MDGRRFRIIVEGRLSERFASAFGGVGVEHRLGETVLVCGPMDQAQLFGVLERVRDLGLQLVGVEAER